MAGHSPEEIRAETRTYLMVFAALATLTAITVAISYLDLSIGAAVTLALLVAAIKGSLVALYFMHLLSERKLIYGILTLTAFFFVMLLSIAMSNISGRPGLEHPGNASVYLEETAGHVP